MKLSILSTLFLACLMAFGSANFNAINAAASGTQRAAMTSDLRPVLSAQDSATIIGAVSKISPEIKAQFECKRAEWKEACNKSDIRYSSFMQDYTKPVKFTELVSMGEPIIPLVIEKMAQGDFFMQLVYEGIRPEDKPRNDYSSGQQRAANYVRMWVETAKRQAK